MKPENVIGLGPEIKLEQTYMRIISQNFDSYQVFTGRHRISKIKNNEIGIIDLILDKKSIFYSNFIRLDAQLEKIVYKSYREYKYQSMLRANHDSNCVNVSINMYFDENQLKGVSQIRKNNNFIDVETKNQLEEYVQRKLYGVVKFNIETLWINKDKHTVGIAMRMTDHTFYTLPRSLDLIINETPYIDDTKFNSIRKDKSQLFIASDSAYYDDEIEDDHQSIVIDL